MSLNSMSFERASLIEYVRYDVYTGISCGSSVIAIGQNNILRSFDPGHKKGELWPGI